MTIEYTVIEDYQSERFIRAVNRHLAMGWELVGGVAVRTSLGNEELLYQAMTRTKKD